MSELINLRIDQHPLGNPQPGDFGIYRDMVNGVTKKFDLTPFLTSNIDNFEWSSTEALANNYDTGDVVTYGGNWYQSAVNNNQSIPGVNSDWTLITKSPSGLVYWQNGVYVEDKVFVVSEHRESGNPDLYFLKASAGRPYVSSDIAAEETSGDWLRMFNNFWPLSGSASLTGDVTVTAGPGEDINLLGTSSIFNVQRDGNRNVQFQIDPEAGAFGDGGIDMSILDPGTSEGLGIKIDDIFFEVASTDNPNNRLRFRGDSTPEITMRAEDGFVSIFEKDVTNNILYSWQMNNANSILIQAQDNANGIGTSFNMLSNEIDISHSNPVSGNSTNIVIGDSEFSLSKVDSGGGTSTEISTDGLDIFLIPDPTGFLDLGIAPSVSAAFTQDHRVIIKFNGVSYYLPLQAV